MRMPKRSTAVLAVAALVALCGAMPQPAAAEPPSWANGRAAVARLGARLDGVAARHGLSSAQLRSNLLNDPSLFVDSADELLYVDGPRRTPDRPRRMSPPRRTPSTPRPRSACTADRDRVA